MLGGFVLSALTLFSPDTLLFWSVPLEGKLPQLSIYSIAADSTGFIWMSTLEGIARWDGETVKTWRTYRLPDGSEDPIVGTLSLSSDRFGHVWAYKDTLLLVKAPQQETFIAYRFPPLKIAPNGTPWLWTACGPLPYALAMASTGCLAPKLNAPVLWTIDAQQQAWWLQKDTLWCQNASALPVAVARWPNLRLLQGDAKGRLWTQQDDQLFAYETLTNCRLQLLQRIPFKANINSITHDDQGRLWIATRSGIFILWPNGKLQQFNLPFPYRTQLTQYVLSLTRDAQGRIWIGTIGGLYSWDPWRPPFRQLNHKQGLESGYVAALLRDQAGRLWVGTIGGGLFVFRPKGNDWQLLRKIPLPDAFVWSLAEDAHGHHWAGTDQGLYCIDCAKQLLPDPSSTQTPGPNTFTALLSDDQTLWAGTYSGTLYRIVRDAPQRFYQTSSIIRSLLKVGDTLWVGMQDGLLRLILNAQGQLLQVQVDTLATNFVVWSQHYGPEGLWLGTNQGLWVRTQNHWLHWDETNGLPSRTLYGLLRSDQDLWAPTNQGLVRINLASFPRLQFRTYTVEEGLGMTEFNRGAYHTDAQGYFYAGGTHGVVWFDPQAIQPYPFAPQPIMLAVLRFQGNTIKEMPWEPSPLVLPPAERTIGFVFRGLFLSFPQGVRYRLTLEGKQREMIELGQRNQLLLSGLRPGTYRLELEAIGPDGQLGRLPEAVRFTVRPYIWETTAFRITVFVLALGLTAGLVFFVLTERHRRLLLTRQVLKNERSRLLRDLHDEVGATLTSIYFLITTLIEQQPAAQTFTNRLRQAAELARTALDQLRLLLWSINPENDRLPILLSYLREIIHQMAEAGNLKLHIEMPKSIPDLPIDAKLRHHLVCIAREGLHNVLRHAKASTVTVEVHLTPHTLTFRLCDDGIGFDPNTTPTRGLRYLQERVQHLKGTLKLISQPGQGTCLEVHTPLPKITRLGD
jgi:ligand-binding sensor domain-containing protein/signal transduction histidine kinase